MNAALPDSLLQRINENDNAVLLDTSKCDSINYRSYLFTKPLDIIEIYSSDELPILFQKIERALTQGYYVAGYFSYECGYHFETIFPPVTSPSPLAWFGVYKNADMYDHRKKTFTGNYKSEASSAPMNINFKITNPRFTISRAEYRRRIKKIKQYITAGDTYQINFTDRFRFGITGSPTGLYTSLREKQKVPYSALIKNDRETILSFSPELFFRRENKNLMVKPMKGTAPRGKTTQEDAAVTQWLQSDEKNRAENLMIVDLLRNDIGRIAEYGSVNVARLYEIEKYRTLFQMTSTVNGIIRDDTTYYSLFKALFPCGSVTGAPKIRSMQIIKELETRRRGIYTGSIGFFAPNNTAVFNVAIRTIVLRKTKGTMGIGSGIVSDSVTAHEYNECILKAEFLTAPADDFELIETMLWDNGGYRFLNYHLERMSDSAEYFGFPFSAETLTKHLGEYATQYTRGTAYKVRVTLNKKGEFSIEHAPLPRLRKAEQHTIILSKMKTDSNNKFLYHKTTERALYHSAYKKALRKGCADIIFMNEKGEITEGAISSVFIKKNGQLITPPVDCGLLAGVYRRHILSATPDAQEKNLYPENLKSADEIYICNAVRGMRTVTLV